jgi:hypothetical protein
MKKNRLCYSAGMLTGNLKLKTFEEMRQHKRLMLQLNVQANVAALPGLPSPKSQRFPCLTRDVSASGMQLRLDRLIPVDTEIDLWVDVPDGSATRTLKLIGDVKWSAPDSRASGYVAGVELRDRPKKEVEFWINMIYEALRRWNF